MKKFPRDIPEDALDFMKVFDDGDAWEPPNPRSYCNQTHWRVWIDRVESEVTWIYGKSKQAPGVWVVYNNPPRLKWYPELEVALAAIRLRS